MALCSAVQHIDNENIRNKIKDSFEKKMAGSINNLYFSEQFIVDSADYKNEKFIFYFTYDGENTKLSYNSSDDYYKYNYSDQKNSFHSNVYVDKDFKIDKCIESFTDSVISHYVKYDN